MKRVFIFGYYGYKNTGDDAILLGLSKALPKCDTRHHYHGDSLRGIIKNILWADIVLLGGGTQLRNWGKKWFMQSMRVLMLGKFARILGKKFYMLNVGIDGKVWEYLAGLVANIITIRDRDTFDSSVLVEFNQQKKEKILGVSLTPVHKIYHNGVGRDYELTISLTQGIELWLKKHHDYKVKFFSFNGYDGWGGNDDDINRTAASFTPKAQFMPWQPDVVKVIEEISRCSAFIGMRYHSCLFAYMAQVPLIVIETYPSCRNLAQFIGVDNLTIEQILSGNFKLRFSKARLAIEQTKALAMKGIVL